MNSDADSPMRLACPDAQLILHAAGVKFQSNYVTMAAITQLSPDVVVKDRQTHYQKRNFQNV